MLPSNVLWYNGDFDGSNALSNEKTATIEGHVYSDFNVTAASGWDVTGLFSNNMMDTGYTLSQASYEIRSGVSAGNGGTLLFSGTAAATRVATGRNGFGLTEYTVTISGLNIHLAPGTYFLNVTPIDSSGVPVRSFNSTTSGANAIGSPAGNNQNEFFKSTNFGANFAPVGPFIGGTRDFSNGVIGTISAVPPTLGVQVGDPAVCLDPGGLVGIAATVTNPNNGALAATFMATLPGGLTAIAGTCVTDVPGTCTIAANGGSVSWNGNLGAGQTVNIIYRARIDANAGPGATFTINNTATVSGPGGAVTNLAYTFTLSFRSPTRASPIKRQDRYWSSRTTPRPSVAAAIRG